jgi:hypothetical protein
MTEPAGYESRSPRQLTGTEYGGVETTFATIQPKPVDTLTPAEILRLGYLTGVDHDTESFEDRRQMLGLRKADGRRPEWLTHVSPQNRPELESEARLQGYGEDE